MRHGRKSQHQRFDGYKLSAAATNTERAADHRRRGRAGQRARRPQAKQLIDAQPERVAPSGCSATPPTAPGRSARELAERDVEVLAPVPEAPGHDGRLAKRDFQIDLDAGTVTCPAGHAAAIRTEPSGQRRATSPSASATRCPLHDRCVAPVARHGRSDRTTTKSC